jgi:uncharacterized protein YheU (UPF0270 family)
MDDIKGVSTIIHKGVVSANDAEFGSDYGEESKSFDQRQQKTDLAFTDGLPDKVNLAPHIFTHWMQMDDIRGVSTICKGLVAAHEAEFGSDFGEKSKSFDQSHQQNDLAFHRCGTRSI